MELGIKGRRALVTGASQGIGRAVALLLAKEGAKVTVIARRDSELSAVVEEMGGEAAGHEAVVADLMEPGIPALVASETLERHGFVDIVINNVGGTLGHKDPVGPVEDWAKVWMYNMGIAVEINSVLAPEMIKKKWGRIVHISSISAVSVRGSTPYASAKAALNAYVLGVGRSLATEGIVMTAVMPGAITAPGGHWEKVEKEDPRKYNDFIRHHMAVGRLGTAEEIAPLTVFLCSDQVTFAQAAVMPLDGGTM